jgi:poly-gamma-glutamate capsule biosynthesis protein CapA/YwtB (metallophosphatase superfamily)
MTAAAAVLASASVAYATAFFLAAHGHAAQAKMIAPRQPQQKIAVAAPALTPKPVARQAVLQPPLALQPAMRGNRWPQPDKQIWLSSTYQPGDARLVDIVAAGDVMMGSADSGLNPDIRPGTDAAALLGDDLTAIFRQADIAFVNLEGPLYDGPNGPVKNCANCYTFRSPTYYAGVLASMGIDAAGLANNHSGDYGEDGREATMAALRAHGIGFGGLDRDGARAATLLLPDGRKAAVAAFAPNDGTLDLNDIPAAEKMIRAWKKTHDLVIVSFHGGAEGWDHVHVARGTEIFAGEDRGDVVRFAHAAIDAGADIVIGQGPHVPRALELYRGHLIAYSLGNFWTYTGVTSYAVYGLGPVLEAWLAPDGTIAGFAIHSTRQAGLGVPHLDPADEAARYVFYLTRSDFPGTDALLESAREHTRLAGSGRPAGGGM